jgi:hypothetical protein
VEYHAIVESCSDKFHVDIPNVVGARGCCTCRVRTARSRLYFALIVASAFLLLQRGRRIKKYQITNIVIVITLYYISNRFVLSEDNTYP